MSGLHQQKDESSNKCAALPNVTPKTATNVKVVSPFVARGSTVPESDQSSQHQPSTKHFNTPVQQTTSSSKAARDSVKDDIPPSSPPVSPHTVLHQPMTLAACLIRFERETGEDLLSLWTSFVECGLGNIHAFSRATTHELLALGVAADIVMGLQEYVQEFIVKLLGSDRVYEEIIWG